MQAQNGRHNDWPPHDPPKASSPSRQPALPPLRCCLLLAGVFCSLRPFVASTILGHCEHQKRHPVPLRLPPPIFAHDPARQCPLPLTSTARCPSKQVFSAIPNRVPFVFRLSSVVSCAAAVRARHRHPPPPPSGPCVLVFLCSATKLALPDFHQHSQHSASASARFDTSSPRLPAFSHASSVLPFFSADHSKSLQAVRKPISHFRLPTHITTCLAR
jgi:hypothetical protein